MDHFITWDGRTTTSCICVRLMVKADYCLAVFVWIELECVLMEDLILLTISFLRMHHGRITKNCVPAFAQYGGVITGLRGKDIGLPKGTVIPPTPIIIQPTNSKH